jgi:hypothetical protein
MNTLTERQVLQAVKDGSIESTEVLLNIPCELLEDMISRDLVDDIWITHWLNAQDEMYYLMMEAVNEFASY